MASSMLYISSHGCCIIIPLAKLPINFGFWLYECRLWCNSTYNDKVSIRTHDKQTKCYELYLYFEAMSIGKIGQNFGTTLGKKNSSQKTHHNKLTKTCWLELHQGSSIGLIQGFIPWWWWVLLYQQPKQVQKLHTWRALICYYST